MKTRIVDFSQLDYDLSLSFATALRNNDFEIISDIPRGDNYPEGLYDMFVRKETYCKILEDNNAECTYYFLRFPIAEDFYGDIPIGVFGTTDKHRLNYPLFGSIILRGFLDIKKADFATFISPRDEEELDQAYSRILAIRTSVMTKIFTFYAFYNNYNSIMSWTLRNKESVTRQVAESIPFIRKENRNSNVEFYSIKELDESELRYFGRCYTAWAKLGANNTDLVHTPKHAEAAEFDLSLFFKQLIADNEVEVKV